MKPTISFPGSQTLTTPLGVGLATLMREPSRKQQQRLLHLAHDYGYRHFDVAPSYGLGAGEQVLGRFLRQRPSGVTVATKVGIRARGNAGLVRILERPARVVLRRFPALRGRATQAVGEAVHVAPDFSTAACTRSLEGSLRSLGVDRLDLLLLHEATPADLADGSAVEWIQRQKERGVVRAIGVATTAHAAGSILAEHPGVFDVVQIPSSVLTPSLNLLAGASVFPITHGVVATPLARAHAKLVRERSWSDELSRLSGTDARAPGELARLLIAWALFENPRGVVLVGTSTEAHLREAPDAVRAFDRSRLATAGEFLRASLDG